MTRIYLQEMVENLPEGILPANWADFDLAAFSPGKRLWEYQQIALRNALRALWRYYHGAPDETLRVFETLRVTGLKQNFMTWYQDFGLNIELDLPLDRTSAAKRKLAALLEYYYASENDKLPYWQFINRMSFWMATGSGKTLVIVKLLEILWTLMQRGEIPLQDVLVLAHRDDLLEQLRQHVNQFNAGGGLFIRLHELREYAETNRSAPSLFRSQEMTVFYYRSDNLSDEQKEKIIDFRSYDHDGRWYILLDEAHKGDKEDSKRQHIYNILSRNGFLFNFSATFTDPRDIVTTVANYNLSEFIRKGHGKHICVLKQEVQGFGRSEDYTEVEKQKIVLKALIMLAYTSQFAHKVRAVQAGLYHRPLMMVLVNSVNTQDADLKLFFRELVRIGRGELDEQTWGEALGELLEELRLRPETLFEPDNKVEVDETILCGLSQADILRDVFNAAGAGEIEVLVRPSNRQEVAFKLRTSEDPFALVRIGDISDWLKQELSGYEVSQRVMDEGFFERLNQPDSGINLLLGSRSFYEGWDSNRPNVIMYVNIGVGIDAKKFILQSVGRGVRIEPLKNQRKRLRVLFTSEQDAGLAAGVFDRVKGYIQPLESVFVFGTNREALNLVLSELDQESKKTGEHEIALEVNEKGVGDKTLLIPVYHVTDTPLFRKRDLAKFALSQDNLELLRRYLEYVPDDRVMLALHDTAPAQVAALRAGMSATEKAFRTDGRTYKNLSVLVNQALSYFSLTSKELAGFKPLEDEISHFRRIKVTLEEPDFSNFQLQLRRFFENPQKIQELKARYDSGQLSFEDLLRQSADINQAEKFDHAGRTVQFKRIAEHFYLPLLVTEDEKLDYIRTLIRVPSEVKFLKDLEIYLSSPNHLSKQFDWWLFSRVDEKTDEITIPFYSPYENKLYNFKPDFIFWLKKGERYHILFVDPKGTSRSEYQHKVDGFRHIFEEDERPVIFDHDGWKVSVHLFLYTQDTQFTAEYYRRYWQDHMGSMIESLFVS
jgi:hypothetical protein